MKTILFDIPVSYQHRKETKISDKEYQNEIRVSILPAFSIEYFAIQIGALFSYQDKDDKIIEDTIHLKSDYSLTDFDLQILIYYHGIRNYTLLFPWIADLSIRQRLGKFYNESEIAFESGSWLSFSLMCGAIFEGILYAKIDKNKSFNGLIIEATTIKLIDESMIDIMNMVRGFRNIVHCNRHKEPYVEQENAMDIRITLDKLIKKMAM